MFSCLLMCVAVTTRDIQILRVISRAFIDVEAAAKVSTYSNKQILEFIHTGKVKQVYEAGDTNYIDKSRGTQVSMGTVEIICPCKREDSIF